VGLVPAAAFWRAIFAAICTRDSSSRSLMRALPGAFFEATCVADFLPAAGFFDPAICWFALAGESTLETVVVLQPLEKMLPAPRQTTPAPAIQPSFRRRSVDPIMTLLPPGTGHTGRPVLNSSTKGEKMH
jgi:hypothetical protein